jgi:predicted nucleic acid-binding protein
VARLIDTDILIDYLRGHPDAVDFLDSNLAEASVSIISVAELYQGVRNGKEQAKLGKMLFALSSLPATAEIAELGGLFSRDHRPAHGCGLADCLVAATAHLHGLTLATLNDKHFPMLPNVQIPYQKP